MAQSIANEYASIGQGLVRIEEERKRKFNPPLVYDPLNIAGNVAWEFIQSGRLQQTRYWYDGDGLVQPGHFAAVDVFSKFIIWLNQESRDHLIFLADRAFKIGAFDPDCIGNIKRLLARLRMLDLI